MDSTPTSNKGNFCCCTMHYLYYVILQILDTCIKKTMSPLATITSDNTANTGSTRYPLWRLTSGDCFVPAILVTLRTSWRNRRWSSAAHSQIRTASPARSSNAFARSHFTFWGKFPSVCGQRETTSLPQRWKVPIEGGRWSPKQEPLAHAG